MHSVDIKNRIKIGVLNRIHHTNGHSMGRDTTMGHDDYGNQTAPSVGRV